MYETISLIHQYDDETFDICKYLIKEIGYYNIKGKNIFHLDRFFIYPQFRGGGIGRHVLDTFEKNINLFVQNRVRFIVLYPDPITEDPEYDSMIAMSIEERNEVIRHLISFYSSLGFVKLNKNPNYMYLDLDNLSIYQNKLSHMG